MDSLHELLLLGLHVAFEAIMGLWSGDRYREREISRFFQTSLRSLSPALLKLFEGLQSYLLLLAYLLVPVFELPDLIHVLNQHIRRHRTVVNAVHTARVIGQFLRNIDAQIYQIAQLMVCDQ